MASRFASGYQSEPFAPPSDRIADPMADIAMPALIPGDCDIGVLRRENNPRDAQKRFHTAWAKSGRSLHSSINRRATNAESGPFTDKLSRSSSCWPSRGLRAMMPNNGQQLFRQNHKTLSLVDALMNALVIFCVTPFPGWNLLFCMRVKCHD